MGSKREDVSMPLLPTSKCRESREGKDTVSAVAAARERGGAMKRSQCLGQGSDVQGREGLRNAAAAAFERRRRRGGGSPLLLLPLGGKRRRRGEGSPLLPLSAGR